MVKFNTDYVFETADGPANLVELFEGRWQLVVYQLMDLGPDNYCSGGSAYTDNTDTDCWPRRSPSAGNVLPNHLRHAVGPNPGLQANQGMDRTLLLLPRHHVQRRLRRWPRLRAQCVPPRWFAAVVLTLLHRVPTACDAAARHHSRRTSRAAGPRTGRGRVSLMIVTREEKSSWSTAADVRGLRRSALDEEPLADLLTELACRGERHRYERGKAAGRNATNGCVWMNRRTRASSRRSPQPRMLLMSRSRCGW